MTFREYVQMQSKTYGKEEVNKYIMAVIEEAASEHDDYRSLSLIFADVPVLHNTFEQLWYKFEDYLDYQNYRKEHSQPEPVSVITGRVLDMLRQRYSVEQ